MAQTDLQDFLLKLNKNLNILKEREAAYGSLAAPLSLLNQIEHYQRAITLAEQAGEQDITYDELQAELEPLNLDLHERIQIEVAVARKAFTGQNPYRGLERFNEENAEFFFGRTETINTLLGHIKDLVDTPTSPAVPDLIAVLGASGSGKSSLVRAGLIPALRRGEVVGSEQWLSQVILPGPRPIDALAGALTAELERGLGPLKQELRAGPEALHDLMVESLIKAEKPEEAVFVLVVDQFEELFTLCEQEPERQAFLDLLLHACQLPYNRSFVIITMRADFYARAGAYQNLANTITKNQILVASMTSHELREAILLPAEKVGLEMEAELALALIQDTAASRGALPLLQHALLELFNRRSDENVLTLAAYQEIGGVRGALAHRADSVLDKLTSEQRQLARNIFIRLTSLGEGVSDTRRRVSRDELYPVGAETGQVDAVLQALSDKNARLVVSDEQTVEVTHEALIQQWGALREWLKEDREALRTHRRLTEAAAEWEANERETSYLYSGARLLEVEEWNAANPGEVNPTEGDFIKASGAARERARRQTQMVIASLAIGLVVAVIGAIFGFVGQNEAEQSAATAEARRLEAETAQAEAETERNNAKLAENSAEAGRVAAKEAQVTAEEERSRALDLALVSMAGEQLDRDPTTAALILTEIEDSENTPFAERRLGEVLRLPLIYAELKHDSPAAHVSFSLDGNVVVTVTEDNTVREWDAKTGVLLTESLRHDTTVTGASASSDGAVVLTAVGSSVWLWDVESGEKRFAEPWRHGDQVNTASFNPDGKLVLTAAGSSVWVWDVETGEERFTEPWKHNAEVNTVLFSPDGKLVLTGAGIRMAQVWDVETGEEKLNIEGDARLAQFSPKGNFVVITQRDSTHVWNIHSGREEFEPLSHTPSPLIAASFSPDEDLLLTASGHRFFTYRDPRADNMLRAWDLKTGGIRARTTCCGHGI
jgi:hypothetical protein